MVDAAQSALLLLGIHRHSRLELSLGHVNAPAALLLRCGCHAQHERAIVVEFLTTALLHIVLARLRLARTDRRSLELHLDLKDLPLEILVSFLEVVGRAGDNTVRLHPLCASQR